ncbi:MAG: GTP-binding protein [Clostridiales bacterium]|nr:GTP-binding protein [Clostridiales bacterium]
MTKINIISGFLGAGKTTLIKKLLEEVFHGEKLVLIENEFGEIGIDGGFLKDAGVEITEMNSGCICCSLVGDFGKAMEKVIHDYTPDRIVIEPSGVGKLSDVIRAVQGVKEKNPVELDCFVTVADATKCKMYMKNFGEFYNNQIESANCIILSRTQNMKAEKLEETVRLLQEHNEKAAIITTPWDELKGDQIVSAMKKAHSLEDELLKLEEEETCPVCGGHHHDHEEHEHDHCHHDHEEHEHDHCHHDHEEHEHDHCHHDHEEHEHDHCHHDHEEHDHDHCHHDHEEHDHEGHHHHHHADDIFTSWGKETPHKYEKTEMEEILKKLSESDEYGTILRAKGMVPASDGTWIYFDLVPGEYEMREGSPEYTGRLCVIGTDLKEPELCGLFHLTV